MSAGAARVRDPAWRKRWTLVASILGLSIVIIDGTVVGIALPEIREDLGASLADQQWILDGYLLPLAALMLLGGALGDLYGRRRLFVIGLVGFAVTSLLCGLAQDPGQLIAARALQGVTGALLIPGTLSLITATFARAERGRAIGSWAAWSGLAGALAPLVGGLLIDTLSWRWIFFLNVPVIAVTLVVTALAVSESRDESRARRLDVPGALLAALGLGGVTFALIEGRGLGWDSPVTLGAAGGGLAALVAFLWVEHRSSHALLPLEYFRSGNFAWANVATLLVYSALSGVFFVLPLFLQGTGGYTALAAGASLLPVTALLLAFSSRIGGLADRLGPRWFMPAGPAVAAVGLLLLLRVGAEADYLTTLLPAITVFGLGLTITVSPLTTTVMNAVEESHAGVASAVNNAMSRVAGLLGIAVLGVLVAVSFGNRVDDAAAAGLGAEARTALAAAREEPFARAEVASLPADARAAVSQAVDAGSVTAFHWAAAGGALFALLGGVASAFGIRNPPRTEPEPRPGAEPVRPCTHLTTAPSGARCAET